MGFGHSSLSSNFDSIGLMLRRILSRIEHRLASNVRRELNEVKMLLAGLHVDRVRGLPSDSPLQKAEFRVFSQAGEDGILQFLIHQAAVTQKIFVELGVETYREANTRYLLLRDDWQGVVVDGSQENIETIRDDEIFWRHELEAVSQFITRENINGLLKEQPIPHDIGLLSIDLDGNDYWIWEEITEVNPEIVVCEYNSVFGDRHSISIPYRADFDRTKAHHSTLYFGASLPALCDLAMKKGYSFVGSNSFGTNAFFVRDDRMGGLKKLTAAQGYVESCVRDARNKDGELTFVSGRDRWNLIKGLPVIDFTDGTTSSLESLAPLYEGEDS